MAPGDEVPSEQPPAGDDHCPERGGSGHTGDGDCATCGGTGVVTEGVGGG
jgi:hypothetical protein